MYINGFISIWMAVVFVWVSTHHKTKILTSLDNYCKVEHINQWFLLENSQRLKRNPLWEIWLLVIERCLFVARCQQKIFFTQIRNECTSPFYNSQTFFILKDEAILMYLEWMMNHLSFSDAIFSLDACQELYLILYEWKIRKRVENSPGKSRLISTFS